MGYIWQSNFDYYFGLNCIKIFARDLLEIETENNIKLNEKMIFNKEDKLHHKGNENFHICGKTCISKVRDHCRETGRNRGPACKMCNLRYSSELHSIMVVVMISIYHIVNSFKIIMIKEKNIAYL